MSVCKYKQSGFSIVELLISLLISSMLVLSLTQVYISSKYSYIFHQNLSGNLENSRFAVLFIDDLLSKAGYRRSIKQPLDEAFPESRLLGDYCEKFDKKSAITKIKSDAASQKTGFCLRYQPAYSGEFVCDGSAALLTQSAPFVEPHINETVYVAIQFNPNITEANKGAVSCITMHGQMQLFEGIADFRVEFGSTPVNDNKRRVTTFKDADSWSYLDGPVSAVRYFILSVSAHNQHENDSVTYRRWFNSANTAVKNRLQLQNNKQIYTVATGGQALRNVIP